jgi:hypothetical protein
MIAALSLALMTASVLAEPWQLSVSLFFDMPFEPNCKGVPRSGSIMRASPTPPNVPGVTILPNGVTKSGCKDGSMVISFGGFERDRLEQEMKKELGRFNRDFFIERDCAGFLVMGSTVPRFFRFIRDCTEQMGVETIGKADGSYVCNGCNSCQLYLPRDKCVVQSGQNTYLEYVQAGTSAIGPKNVAVSGPAPAFIPPPPPGPAPQGMIMPGGFGPQGVSAPGAFGVPSAVSDPASTASGAVNGNGNGTQSSDAAVSTGVGAFATLFSLASALLV